MVKTPSQALEKFIVRLPDGMRDAIGAIARGKGRSMNSQIVAMIAESLQMSPPPTEMGEIPTSRTAKEALALAQKNAARLDGIEARLTDIEALGSDVPNFATPQFLERLAALEKRLPKK